MLYIFISTYVFALQSRFYNPVKRTLFNAFFMSVRHLLQTIGIIALDVLTAAAAYFGVFFLPQVAMLLILSPDCLYQFLFLYGNLPEIYAKERGA